jgi:hypothetical protein
VRCNPHPPSSSQNIKDLNSQKKSHAEALAAARALFGTSGEDLYFTFESMIGRHLK